VPLGEAGSVPSGPGQSVVRVDPVLGHTPFEEHLSLCLEILGVG